MLWIIEKQVDLKKDWKLWIETEKISDILFKS